MFKEYPDVVTVKEIKKMLGIGRNTAYQLIQNNSIKSMKIGRNLKIPKTEVIKFVRINTSKDTLH